MFRTVIDIWGQTGSDQNQGFFHVFAYVRNLEGVGKNLYFRFL